MRCETQGRPSLKATDPSSGPGCSISFPFALPEPGSLAAHRSCLILCMCPCWTCQALSGSGSAGSGAEGTVPRPDHHRVVPGAPRLPPAQTRAHSPWISSPMSIHLCILPIPAWWSWSKGEAAGSAWCCPDTNCCTLASLLGVLLAFSKAFKRKGKLCSFFLSFLSACPSCSPTVRCAPALCPCCPEETEWVWGCGAAWELFLSSWFMSKRNNNNKTFDGKQGDQEVQLVLRPDL